MRHWLKIALAVLALTTLLGADCPLTLNPGSGSTGTSSTSSVDVGGTSGALWQLQLENEMLVTLTQSGQAAAKKVSLTGSIAPVELLSQTLDLASFCWRSDVACPQSVLPEQTVIVQPSSGGVALSFNRRGPLAARSDQSLAGTLDGKELSVPLVSTTSTSTMCPLGTSSAILGTAFASSGTGTTADTVQGRITVSYGGTCVDLGGGAIASTSVLELSIGFTAKRR